MVGYSIISDGKGLRFLATSAIQEWKMWAGAWTLQSRIISLWEKGRGQGVPEPISSGFESQTHL